MKKWLVCLKHGDKYSTEYVNILYSMAKRNSSVPFGFACITEDSIGLHPDIIHIPIPNYHLHGWWYKPWVFSREFPLHGSIIFMDLDIVINQSIDSLWDFSPDKLCIIKDFVKISIPSWCGFNSSVFKFEYGQFHHIWDDLISDIYQISNYRGDQEWIKDQIYQTDQYEFWPDDWIVSYKWQVRSKNDLIRGDDGRLLFKSISDVTSESKILAFHGTPDPHEVMDPIVTQNWVISSD